MRFIADSRLSQLEKVYLSNLKLQAILNLWRKRGIGVIQYVGHKLFTPIGHALTGNMNTYSD